LTLKYIFYKLEVRDIQAYTSMQVRSIQQVVKFRSLRKLGTSKKEFVPKDSWKSRYVHRQAYDRTGSLIPSLMPPTVSMKI
jgi:hypothetical protein